MALWAISLGYLVGFLNVNLRGLAEVRQAAQAGMETLLDWRGWIYELFDHRQGKQTKQ